MHCNFHGLTYYQIPFFYSIQDLKNEYILWMQCVSEYLRI